MHHLHSVITLFILLSFFRRSYVSSCSYLSTVSTSHTFQPYQTACQADAYLTHFSVLCAGAVTFFLHAFFSLVTLNLTQDLLTLLYALSVSVPFFTLSILLPYLISLSPIIQICSVLPKLGLKTPLPALNLLHST